MPTTVDEARKITTIINEYLTPMQAREITRKLDESVGKRTDNSSLQISLQMLRSLYEQQTISARSRRIKTTLLILTVIGHMIIVVANIAAIFILPFVVPWYIAFPLITFVINLMFSPIPCPLTKLECRLRVSLGLPEVRAFVKHYFFEQPRKILRIS